MLRIEFRDTAFASADDVKELLMDTKLNLHQSIGQVPRMIAERIEKCSVDMFVVEVFVEILMSHPQ